MDLRPRFDATTQAFLPAIEAVLDAVPRESCPPGSTLPEMCAYHLGTGGKRIRALVPLLVAQDLGTDPADLVPFGAACEMLHNATLVHDDLQDGDTVRRGEPTVWRRFGEAQAVNLGDAMFYFALLCLDRLAFPPERRARVARLLLVETLRVIDGQEREFALKTLEAPTLEAYTRMVEGKTSGLFVLPLQGAALLCGAPAEVESALCEAARHLGVLFQIQDDVLDLYGEKGRGERGSDLAEGKRSVLVLHALAHAPVPDAAWLTALLDAPREAFTPAHAARAAELFRSSGSLAFAIDGIRARRERARAALARWPALAELAEGLCDLSLGPIHGILLEEGRP
ncbi:MAG: polyprenyl synthetase family protein [Deltaproteobacteria bacterium]|nr:polyprenyl synthetase family protein [Deltaproteobacteria bacterium]